ncbi:polysaccharide pyruvyl transferase family protein (plasmid) [Cetobacterium somerae]|uniref:polysaccharide pyruvyl transferase family protein n=1 Tax=Cetobacterium somerae TaxID=188913 RepID=UPI001F05C73B|nr:polysaccharide pyruvyl transferase family protein [Cetobacterium somerae]UPO98528.1 polysaccharide pyruvyl transferase family protein [Cetobacterium somerae]
MKVGLLTFHNAINYGAALQVYASQKAIKSLGAECEVIDYVNESRKNAYNTNYHAFQQLKNKKIISSLKYFLGGIFLSSRKQKFLKFYDKNLICTKKTYKNMKEAETLNEKYDKFIVGSDQVWNYKNNGRDFSFLLEFVKNKSKKISYSSSFGLASIPEEYKNLYIKNLKDIKNISCRESCGIELIEELTGRKAQLVLDPVFLLSKKEWLSLCNIKPSKFKYIFSYTNKPNQWENFIEKTNYQIEDKKVYKISKNLKINDFLSSKIKISYSISPIEFIETIANAELVVSASFHCIAMAIILNVPFVAILVGDKGKDERVLNILRITGLENRIFNERMTEKEINTPIDYEVVQEKLDKYIKSSVKFLKDSIFN